MLYGEKLLFQNMELIGLVGGVREALSLMGLGLEIYPFKFRGFQVARAF